MVARTTVFADLDSLLSTYRIQARTEGKSADTLRIYTTALTVLGTFLAKNGYSTDVTTIGPHQIREFIGHLQITRAYMQHPFTPPQEKGLTGHTINCYLRAIRAFWGWLAVEEIIETNPFDKVRIPKPPRKVIVPLGEDQIRAVLDVIDTKSQLGFRDWAIIMVFLDTGVRASELIGMQKEDADLTRRCLKVSGKGNRERIVPIGVTVQKAVAKYLRKYRPDPAYPLCDNVFLNRDGTPLTRNRIEKLILQYGTRAGVQGVRLSPHTLRHTFAISYLRNGGDVFTLQRILGHESLDMVRNYVNVALCDLQEAHLRCSPIDNLRVRATGSPRQSIASARSILWKRSGIEKLR